MSLPPTAVSDRSCDLCPKVRFSDTRNTPSCKLCPASKFQDTKGQGYCEAKQPCEPGTYDTNVTDTSSARCKLCPAGFWCQGNATESCGSASQFCPPGSRTPTAVAIGHYSTPLDAPEDQRTGQARCEDGMNCDRGLKKACTSGRLCRLGSATARVGDSYVNVTAETLCDADKFAFEGKCLSCPDHGAHCIIGEITLKDDFWFDHWKHGSLTDFWGKREQGALSKAFRICQCAPGSCRSDATSQRPICTTGRTGLLCGECEVGYYAMEDRLCSFPCRVCSDRATTDQPTRVASVAPADASRTCRAALRARSPHR